VDSLVYPKCDSDMKIIAFIEDYNVIKKILDYLSIYEFTMDKPPPKIVSVANIFDNYRCDDYIDIKYIGFLVRVISILYRCLWKFL